MTVSSRGNDGTRQKDGHSRRGKLCGGLCHQIPTRDHRPQGALSTSFPAQNERHGRHRHRLHVAPGEDLLKRPPRRMDRRPVPPKTGRRREHAVALSSPLIRR
uniref:Uncharacterized protein n=1 Tax=Aegilops tauschii subsp. strangulata TaxID=200361 RepID=A0A453S973_AEGTS